MAALPATATTPARPRLAAGLELIGAYRDSGFREVPYLVRHADGRFAQLPELLYLVAAHADGRRTVDSIARTVGERIGRAVSARNVEVLLEKLHAAGIVGASDGAVRSGEHVDPLLALRFRAAMVPARFTRITSLVLRPLFLPIVAAAALAALLGLDAWLFLDHGVAQGVREILMHPALLLAVLGLVILGTVFHELGHAAACAYGGARPGSMGIGLYVVWPAFYTDVTDAYRLGRGGRVRTDLGGVYFNALYALAAGGAFFATHADFLLAVVVLQHGQILQQLMPWGRLDGYYVLTDLTGVPDMLSRVGPVLRGLLPGREDDPRVRALKPWVRAVATVYVLTLVPVVALTIALLAVGAPRVMATAIQPFAMHLDAAAFAVHRAQWAAATLAAAQAVTLLTPALGMTLMALGVARRLSAAAATWSPPVAVAAASTAGAAAATACLVWWPGAGSSPIRADARGTVPDGISALTGESLRSGRAATPSTDAPGRGPASRPAQPSSSSDPADPALLLAGARPASPAPRRGADAAGRPSPAHGSPPAGASGPSRLPGPGQGRTAPAPALPKPVKVTTGAAAPGLAPVTPPPTAAATPPSEATAAPSTAAQQASDPAPPAPATDPAPAVDPAAPTSAADAATPASTADPATPTTPTKPTTPTSPDTTTTTDAGVTPPSPAAGGDPTTTTTADAVPALPAAQPGAAPRP